MTLLAAPALPLHKAGPYVAAAYLVLLLLVIVYVAIMAVRLGRTQRDLARLQREVETARDHRDSSSEEMETLA